MDMICTVEELAPLIRCSEWTLRRMLRDGEVRGTKVGNRWLVNATREFPEIFGRREVGGDAKEKVVVLRRVV